jgi:hypothetical protein
MVTVTQRPHPIRLNISRGLPTPNDLANVLRRLVESAEHPAIMPYFGKCPALF